LDVYGSFCESDGTYILTNPHTPRSWQHALSNDDYLLVLSQWAGGYSVYESILTNTVTKKPWPPSDETGRFFYIRDADTGECWSPTIWPVHNSLEGKEEYKCTYGHGTLSWDLLSNALRSKLMAMVALDDCVELYTLELENLSHADRQIDVFSYLEWEFSGAPIELGAAMQVHFDKSLNCQISELLLPPQYRAKQTGFLACDQKILSYDGWRDAFLGRPGTATYPAAVEKGICSNSANQILGHSCGAIQTRVKIPAGSKTKLCFAVGVVNEKNEIPALVERYLDAQSIDRELERIRSLWQEKLSGLEFSTPDGSMDHFNNTWLKYQLVQNVRWVRWGADKGFRDGLSDSAGLRLIESERPQETILTAAGKQRSDGHAPRQWTVTPWAKDNWQDYRDSCFWLVYALEKYLKETGNFDFLETKVPFCDSTEAFSLFEHADRSMEFLWQNRGEHGLCLIGQGDWLDSLNAAGEGGKGESVMLSQAACYALGEMSQIAERIGEGDKSETYQQRRRVLADAINTHAWDGSWYLQAYNDLGDPIGSHTCSKGGKIFLMPQSWAVLSGVADSNRAKEAMSSTEKMLSSQYGYLVFSPMYQNYDPNIGRLCLWPSEAVSAYCHSTLFKVIADCMLGEGDRAWNTLRAITPASGEIDLSKTGSEPFCLTNCFAGPDWSYPGWSYTGWWTGTASWMLQAVAEWIFGVRADYQGLVIDPCLPKAWTNVTIKRPFRGCLYDVTIMKSSGVCKGEVKLKINNEPVEGNRIPPRNESKCVVMCEIV